MVMFSGNDSYFSSGFGPMADNMAYMSGMYGMGMYGMGLMGMPYYGAYCGYPRTPLPVMPGDRFVWSNGQTQGSKKSGIWGKLGAIAVGTAGAIVGLKFGGKAFSKLSGLFKKAPKTPPTP